MRAPSGERTFNFGVNAFLVVVLLVTLVPLLYVVQISLTPLSQSGRTLFNPLDWTVQAYRELLGQPAFLRAALNSVVITALGVLVNVTLTVLTAYPLSRRDLPGKNLFLFAALFTFLFHAGMVPTYLLVRDLGLLNTLGALVLPGAISVYNLFVVRAFFMNLPDSLEEAARMDGANDWHVLWHIVLPLSKPILLTIGLFYAVGHWNDFFTPLLYLSDRTWMPLPLLLRDILTGAGLSEYSETGAVSRTSQDALQMAAVVLTTLPMLIVYPWIQRHFTKGVLLGSVKE